MPTDEITLAEYALVQLLRETALALADEEARAGGHAPAKDEKPGLAWDAEVWRMALCGELAGRCREIREQAVARLQQLGAGLALLDKAAEETDVTGH